MIGFKVHKTDDGRVLPCEYFTADGLTPQLGMALKLSGGKLVKASGAEAPAFISMAERTAACQAGEIIPVLRVGPDVIWETEAGAALTGKKPGDKVGIHTDAMTVSAAAGAAEIVSLEDSPSAGSRVTVRFGAAAAAAST